MESLIHIILFLLAVGTSTAAVPPVQLAFCVELPTANLSTYFTAENINYLKQLNGTVILGTIDFSSERAEAVQSLNTAGIEVVAWLLLDVADGYWMNMDNYPAATVRYSQFREWASNYSLNFKAVGFDLEVDMQNVIEIENKSWVELFESVASRTLEKLEEARASFSQLADTARADGYLVQSYTLPWIYDERDANSTFMQRLVGIVNMENVALEVPMLYTTGVPYGLGFLNSYANTTQNYKSVAIGVTGGIGDVGGAQYANWTQFQHDILYVITQMPWVHQIGIYSFEGIVDHSYFPLLIDFDWGASLPPEALQNYQQEGQILDEQRLSIFGLLEATKNWKDALVWAETHPYTVVQQLIDLLVAYSAWKNHKYPPL